MKKILILILISINSCMSTNNNHWDLITASGLNSHISYNKIHFTSVNKGYILGSDRTEVYSQRENLTGVYLNMEAVILTTNDGGLNWHRKYLDKGSVEDISDDGLTLLKRSYHGNDADTVKSHILKFDTIQYKWHEIQIIEEKVSKIKFYNNKGIAFIDNKNRILKTEDGGKEWTPITLAKTKTISDYKSDNCGNIFFISDNVLVKQNAFSGETEYTDIVLEKDEFTTGLLIDNNNNVYSIIAKNEEYFVLNNIYKEKESIDLSFMKYTIDEVYLYDDIVHIFASKFEGTRVYLYFFHSDDKGKNWEEEKLPIDYKAYPFAFYGKNHVWAYVLNQQFQVRK